MHPKTLTKKLTRHVPEIEELLNHGKFPSGVFMLIKNKYYLNEIGYQCFKTETITTLNETWLFQYARAQQTNIVPLTRLECLTLVESEMCDGHKMQCNNDGCAYIAQPEEKFYYNYDNRIRTTNCAFNKKQIIAEEENSQLYFSPSNKCKPRDLSCSLYNSIIVWSNETRTLCPYTKVHYGANYTLSETSHFDHHNIIFSTIDNLSFQIVNVTSNCNIRMFVTSSDILLAIENDPKASMHKHLERANNKNAFNKQHDINNLLLAEIDNYKHAQWIREQEKANFQNYINCINLRFRLNQISKDDDTFNIDFDDKGNQITTFTSQNIIYLPICTPVFKVNLTSTKLCYKEAQVTYTEALLGNKNKIERIGYVTKSNVIRDSSIIIDCSLVHYSQVLPDSEHILVRRKEKNSIFNINHMVMVDLSRTSHLEEDINLNHCKEIVNNYQTSQLVFEFESLKQNDCEGKFFSMPNDHLTSELEFKSDTKNSIASLQDRVISYIETSTILSSVFGFISTILIVYIAFKIISAIIQACIATKAIKITQVHEPTHVNAQTLEKELALLKANLASNIFPKLPTENTYIDSTFNSSI